MICIICNHDCHCRTGACTFRLKDILPMCGCEVCKHEEENMFKKIWKKIKEFFKRLMFWTR
jgi:hypothetical protein